MHKHKAVVLLRPIHRAIIAKILTTYNPPVVLVLRYLLVQVHSVSIRAALTHAELTHLPRSSIINCSHYFYSQSSLFLPYMKSSYQSSWECSIDKGNHHQYDSWRHQIGDAYRIYVHIYKPGLCSYFCSPSISTLVWRTSSTWFTEWTWNALISRLSAKRGVYQFWSILS